MGIIDPKVIASLREVEAVIRKEGIRSQHLKSEDAVNALLDRLNISPLQREYLREEILWGAEEERY